MIKDTASAEHQLVINYDTKCFHTTVTTGKHIPYKRLLVKAELYLQAIKKVNSSDSDFLMFKDNTIDVEKQCVPLGKDESFEIIMKPGSSTENQMVLHRGNREDAQTENQMVLHRGDREDARNEMIKIQTLISQHMTTAIRRMDTFQDDMDTHRDEVKTELELHKGALKADLEAGMDAHRDEVKAELKLHTGNLKAGMDEVSADLKLQKSRLICFEKVNAALQQNNRTLAAKLDKAIGELSLLKDEVQNGKKRHAPSGSNSNPRKSKKIRQKKQKSKAKKPKSKAKKTKKPEYNFHEVCFSKSYSSDRQKDAYDKFFVFEILRVIAVGFCTMSTPVQLATWWPGRWMTTNRAKKSPKSIRPMSKATSTMISMECLAQDLMTNGLLSKEIPDLKAICDGYINCSKGLRKVSRSRMQNGASHWSKYYIHQISQSLFAAATDGSVDIYKEYTPQNVVMTLDDVPLKTVCLSIGHGINRCCVFTRELESRKPSMLQISSPHTAQDLSTKLCAAMCTPESSVELGVDAMTKKIMYTMSATACDDVANKTRIVLLGTGREVLSFTFKQIHEWVKLCMEKNATLLFGDVLQYIYSFYPQLVLLLMWPDENPSG